MSEKRKGRILYLGMDVRFGEIEYLYKELNPDNTLGDSWRFNNKLFTKGSVGAFYDCSFIGSKVSYSKKDYPSYLIEVNPGQSKSTHILFPELKECEVKNTQAEIVKRNRTKPKPDVLKYEIEEIRRIYKKLSNNQKPRFIADLVYQITK